LFAADESERIADVSEPALSPWQFKDLNDGNFMDAWVQKSDTLFASRFKQILNDPNTNNTAPFLPDIIELLTWNDFCESHYLRDLSSPLEASSDYADFDTMAQYIYGHDHSPWRLMAQYYIAWWKTGAPPTVTQDRVVFWYRVHPKNAVCSGGSSTGSAIRNYDLVADAVFAWALVKKAATISLSLGDNKGWTFHVDPKLGPTIGSIPFPEDLGDHAVGVKPEVAVMRNGTVVQFAQGALPVTMDCGWQNFNPVVGLAGAGLGVPI
jgi:glucan endo-1,3-alpha-glucosidase